ncbi:hypothetical protein PanWU01x14_035550 [Parasponia andersonii]|uniref:Uncharacterized protein n=1 Tax=Parasponia andersonii TaxID=3476 RepID=A0A2P5DT85_PARAD|nr:hypothetical protein PanWU01x14_035550 [Parasponia andersonii]
MWSTPTPACSMSSSSDLPPDCFTLSTSSFPPTCLKSPLASSAPLRRPPLQHRPGRRPQKEGHGGYMGICPKTISALPVTPSITSPNLQPVPLKATLSVY